MGEMGKKGKRIKVRASLRSRLPNGSIDLECSNGPGGCLIPNPGLLPYVIANEVKQSQRLGDRFCLLRSSQLAMTT